MNILIRNTHDSMDCARAYRMAEYALKNKTCMFEQFEFCEDSVDKKIKVRVGIDMVTVDFRGQ